MKHKSFKRLQMYEGLTAYVGYENEENMVL